MIFLESAIGHAPVESVNLANLLDCHGDDGRDDDAAAKHQRQDSANANGGHSQFVAVLH